MHQEHDTGLTFEALNHTHVHICTAPLHRLHLFRGGSALVRFLTLVRLAARFLSD